jgi:hypothetical protein
MLTKPSFDLGGDVVKAFRPQKEAVATATSPRTAAESHPSREVRVGGAGCKVKIPRAALGVEAVGHRDRFEQGAFAGAVLADEERYVRVEV